jgi:hypothetical protein
MTNNEIYLAEKGLLMPIQNPDWKSQSGHIVIYEIITFLTAGIYYLY